MLINDLKKGVYTHTKVCSLGKEVCAPWCFQESKPGMENNRLWDDFVRLNWPFNLWLSLAFVTHHSSGNIFSGNCHFNQLASHQPSYILHFLREFEIQTSHSLKTEIQGFPGPTQNCSQSEHSHKIFTVHVIHDLHVGTLVDWSVNAAIIILINSFTIL